MMPRSGLTSITLGETHGYKQRKNAALKGLNYERVCQVTERFYNYIKNQQEHHKKESFEDELRRLLQEQGIGVNDKYFP